MYIFTNKALGKSQCIWFAINASKSNCTSNASRIPGNPHWCDFLQRLNVKLRRFIYISGENKVVHQAASNYSWTHENFTHFDHVMWEIDHRFGKNLLCFAMRIKFSVQTYTVLLYSPAVIPTWLKCSQFSDQVKFTTFQRKPLCAIGCMQWCNAKNGSRETFLTIRPASMLIKIS